MIVTMMGCEVALWIRAMKYATQYNVVECCKCQSVIELRDSPSLDRPELRVLRLDLSVVTEQPGGLRRCCWSKLESWCGDAVARQAGRSCLDIP